MGVRGRYVGPYWLNVNHVLGSMHENAPAFWPAYASSTAALNMLLHGLAARAGRTKAIIAMAPG